MNYTSKPCDSIPYSKGCACSFFKLYLNKHAASMSTQKGLRMYSKVLLGFLGFILSSGLGFASEIKDESLCKSEWSFTDRNVWHPEIPAHLLWIWCKGTLPENIEKPLGEEICTQLCSKHGVTWLGTAKNFQSGGCNDAGCRPREDNFRCDCSPPKES